MCFSVNANIPREHLKLKYGLPFEDRADTVLGYFTTAFQKPFLPIIAQNHNEIKWARWGLIPSFIRNKDEADAISLKTVNARAESLLEKSSFKSSAINEKCIVPILGFFEWQHIGKQRIPYYIKSASNTIFSVAGLYSCWKDGESLLTTFTIITVPANPLMAEIHNSGLRMPAILEDGHEQEWIQGNSIEAMQWLKAYSQGKMKAHKINASLIKQGANVHNSQIIEANTDYQQGFLF